MFPVTPNVIELTSTAGYAAVGEAIRVAREKSGMNLRQLADKVKGDKDALSRIERGQQKIGVMELVRLARALDQEPMYLFSTAVNAETQAQAAR